MNKFQEKLFWSGKCWEGGRVVTDYLSLQKKLHY